MPLTSGTKLGPYEIVAPLGAGGMGEVYRARDTRLGRDVAIKVLPAHLSADADLRSRFAREARSISQLNHPHICTLYDVGQHDGVDFLVLELLDGESLRSRLAAGPFSIANAAEFAAQIVAGLAAAHDKGIVHRDLKPENIIITRDGALKILDFGLAKQTSPIAGGTDSASAETTPIDATMPGAIFGTVGYMSPEQVRGLPADARSDLFAFGAILYEMLSGRRAFAGASSAEVLSATLRDEPRALATLDARIPAELERIVGRCLEKDPAKRPESAKALAHDLRRMAAAPADSNASSRGAHRRSSSLWLAAVVAAAAIAFIVADAGGIRSRLFESAPPRKIVSLAVLPLSNLSGNSDDDYFADGVTEELRADLAGIVGLRVASRSAAARHAGSTQPVEEIARKLGVDALVRGSVARTGDRVSVDAALLDGASGRRLWSERFERDARDVPSLHGQIAGTIARKIRLDVSAEERKRLATARVVDPVAHEAYLRGRFYWNKRDKDALKKGLDQFARAVDLDPDYAAAYAGLADSYVILGVYNFMPPKEAFPAAKAAAAKALELDETLAEAHASLGDAHLHFDRDWEACKREHERALELDASYVTAHHWYGEYFIVMNRPDDALAEMREAVRLDPFSLVSNSQLAWALNMARRYDEAIEVARKTLELDSTWVAASLHLAFALEQTGKLDEAVGILENAAARSTDSRCAALLGRALACAGRTAQAKEILASLFERAKLTYVSPYDFAQIYVGLGDTERALEWLGKALEDRAGLVPFLGVDPAFDPLRSDPRFAEILSRAGLAS
ncbi:MAG: protein kinase domain-containing protein [bacterium]